LLSRRRPVRAATTPNRGEVRGGGAKPYKQKGTGRARQGSTRAPPFAGGGRKPYRQKGTGRARQGSIRAPQFTGGGVVHGPTPHGYEQRTPKKMKAAALRGALSDRARDGRVHIVERFVDGDSPSTKSAVGVLAAVTERPKALVVVERGDTQSWLSLRNAAGIHVLAVDQLNTYDVLASDDVVFTKAAYDALLASRGLEPATVTAPTKTAKKAPAKKAAEADDASNDDANDTDASATDESAAKKSPAKKAAKDAEEPAAKKAAKKTTAKKAAAEASAEPEAKEDDA